MRAASPFTLSTATLCGCLFVVGCSAQPVRPDSDAGRPGAVDASAPVLRCGAGDDPDGDFISSMDERDGDPDSDGIPSRDDHDSDGDGISDPEEAGDSDCSTPPVDTDRDGTPDFLDADSDADTIPDGLEGRSDSDGDGTPSFRDFDSDGDGVPDAEEAGDGDLATPPAACSVEINPVTEAVESDGLADFQDNDSDNDGLGDGEELAIGTDPCDIDSDNDRIGDLAEGAYERFNCPDGAGSGGVDCGCATNESCGIPPQHFYVVLPYMGAPEERDLDFGTSIRVADVFFLTDTTGSMGGTLMSVQQTVAGAGGIIDRIRETIPDAWVGGGQFDDMPFFGYGSTLSMDEPFRLAIGMTPPDRAADVQAAFNAIAIHNGSDLPESGTEALHQLLVGTGGTWMAGAGTSYTMPRYVGACLDGGWGAACFRDAALPIVVHFTDICSHNGPDDDSPSCDDYTGITPAPAEWTDMIAEMNLRGAKFIGVNASTSVPPCSISAPGPSGQSPCHFLRRTAEETRSVDIDGNALVYDLPNSGDRSVFLETIVGAIETVATRVPLDVDTALRDDPSDPGPGVDATRFIVRRQPKCEVTGTDDCWVAPAGVDHQRAVATYDTSTFFGVVPGTRVTFRITFQNTFQPGGRTAQLYVAFIDVRGGGSAVLDTRQVFIVVPADDSPILG